MIEVAERDGRQYRLGLALVAIATQLELLDAGAHIIAGGGVVSGNERTNATAKTPRNRQPTWPVPGTFSKASNCSR